MCDWVKERVKNYGFAVLEDGPQLLEIEMANDAKELTAKIDIVRLGKGQGELFKKLLLAFQEAFQEQNPPTSDRSHLNQLLDNDSFIVYVAISDDQVLGGLTAYELPMYYDRSSEIFVYDIGIRSEYQRQGLGKLLLENLKAYAQQRGIPHIFVAAHEEDQHALDFYRGAGWLAEKVVHFNWEVKSEA